MIFSVQNGKDVLFQLKAKQRSFCSSKRKRFFDGYSGFNDRVEKEYFSYIL